MKPETVNGRVPDRPIKILLMTVICTNKIIGMASCFLLLLLAIFPVVAIETQENKKETTKDLKSLHYLSWLTCKTQVNRSIGHKNLSLKFSIKYKLQGKKDR